MRFQVDPFTRHVLIAYKMPATAPDSVTVRCTWSRPGTADWRLARVEPSLSDTALALIDEDAWRTWSRGLLVERRAAGLERAIIFNPYPDAEEDGRTDVIFRIEVLDENGGVFREMQQRVQADNSDVVTIDDWSAVMQREAISEDVVDGAWHVQRGLSADSDPSVVGVARLYGPGEKALPALTYPLALKGMYAIHVCSAGAVKLRLSGDERYDRLGSSIPRHERLWKWARMDWQHLIVRQNYAFTGPAATSIDYVRCVPITPQQASQLEERFGVPDRLVVSYWEPYSYAFSDNVQNVFWHREYLGAYRDADVSIVDIQLGSFGMKVVYESRVSDQLLYQTRGDPIGAIRQPTTTNVGRMQQYTNTLQNSLKFGEELGLTVHANFGASNCYPGSPLQGDFSKQHPEWMRGSALRYEVPEVREFVLALYQEALDIGAPGLSIDFCRYPETIDSVETCNQFFRELRALADAVGEKRGKRVSILTRFPAHGVRLSQYFDYVTWVREGWVDYLCPSSIQGRFHYFDVTAYQEAVSGSDCVLLPQIDALSWGLRVPGLLFWRAAQLYDHGVDGIYIYQGDALIAHDPGMRRYVRMLRSSAAVRRFWEEDTKDRPTRSKGIYITGFNQLPGYHRWERLHVWLEGIPMGELEIYLDDKRVHRYDRPPYMLGDQSHKGDTALPKGEHDLRIRARDGDGWLEQTFHIVSGG